MTRAPRKAGAAPPAPIHPIPEEARMPNAPDGFIWSSHDGLYRRRADGCMWSDDRAMRGEAPYTYDRRVWLEAPREPEAPRGPEIAPGDFCMLKVGGPRMVAGATQNDPMRGVLVHTTWMDSNGAGIINGYFHPKQLDKVP